MKTFTRDDTEHGKEYVLSGDAQAKIDLLMARVKTLESAVREAATLADFAETWITDPAIEGARRLKGRGDRFRALLRLSGDEPTDPVATQIKPAVQMPVIRPTRRV